MISWLKANMRAFFNDTISADILKQLQSGTQPVDVKLDVSAPHLKHMLAVAFAKALSELPAETVRHCWAPLQAAYDDMEALHAEAATQLERLFPKSATYVPNGNEEEPSSDADDDYEEPAPKGASAQRQRAEAEKNEHLRAADAAAANGIPARRPARAAAAAANAAMDALEERGELA
jgi:hypothetical protein